MMYKFRSVNLSLILFFTLLFCSGLANLIAASSLLFSKLCWGHYLPEYFWVRLIPGLLFLGFAVIPIVLMLQSKHKFDVQSDNVMFSLFTNYRRLFVCLFIAANALILMHIGTLNLTESINRLAVIAADKLQQYKMAEEIFSHSDRYWAGSFYSASNRCNQKLTEEEHQQFLNNISKVYGAKSVELGESLIDYSVHFHKKKEYLKAEDALIESQKVFESIGNGDELRPMCCLAISRSKRGDIKGTKDILLSALEKIKDSKKTSHLTKDFEELCTDKKMKSEFASFAKIIPQRLNASRQKINEYKMKGFTRNVIDAIQVLLAVVAGSISIFILSTTKARQAACIKLLKAHITKSRNNAQSIELLTDLIALELSRKNYDEVQKQSQRFLKLAEESV